MYGGKDGGSSEYCCGLQAGWLKASWQVNEQQGGLRLRTSGTKGSGYYQLEHKEENMSVQEDPLGI